MKRALISYCRTTSLCGLVAALFSGHLFAKPIDIRQQSDLFFGNGPQGDPPKVVPPGTGENGQNASFIVRGDKNRVYTIILPTTGQLIHSGGTDSINIFNFQSFPAEGANGLLDDKGRQILYVGATRDMLRFNQSPGDYTGTFTVQVVY